MLIQRQDSDIKIIQFFFNLTQHLKLLDYEKNLFSFFNGFRS